MISAALAFAGLGAAQRVLVTDGLAPAALDALAAGGADVTSRSLTEDELCAGALAAYDAVIVRSATTLRADALSAGAAGRLRVVGRAGVGVDNIDVAGAHASGVTVVNTPSASTASVVEMTLALLFAAARNLPAADRGLRSGEWLKPPARGEITRDYPRLPEITRDYPREASGSARSPSPQPFCSRLGSELAGKNLGLLGFGRIARGVAAAAAALGMRVFAYSPHAASETAAALPGATTPIPCAASLLGVTLLPSAEELFCTCSHVSLHCALTPQTRLLMLERMPAVGPDGAACGSHLINVARGGIADEAAVAAALHAGTLTSYASDDQEPLPADHPLLGCPGFIGTPHIGGATREAQDRVGLQIAAAVLAVLDGRVPEDGVVGVA
ncbi:D-3-phosphoglycerate dehydrogenase [Emiliania huxleyi CCMP1516]|uniref:D-3-phosphoglycerate dehydrogenase n=4 Tax=Emiliania huxleyi TaxID=2903 RepID=A0A0D3KP71_EMIH1|nr:D-3-phosphoglycerate dehydrogenase [Emiliania huxleyi CCMP1516]EOD37556.1 D-3-phosphoglycerate dehydrogenase [Emiliania huxleyi CCMP1516]|eukprot:XP_005789985.1 D-3-phosphoglycerate dehydrogenase [Emiliania huxleyi CCMP1516]